MDLTATPILLAPATRPDVALLTHRYDASKLAWPSAASAGSGLRLATYEVPAVSERPKPPVQPVHASVW